MSLITVMQNQSMLDVILQATGSLEAGMQFCTDNGVSISDVPIATSVMNVTDSAIAAAGSNGAVVVSYLAKNNVILATLAQQHVGAAFVDSDGGSFVDSDGEPFVDSF